jgi:hypothetical protein
MAETKADSLSMHQPHTASITNSIKPMVFGAAGCTNPQSCTVEEIVLGRLACPCSDFSFRKKGGPELADEFASAGETLTAAAFSLARCSIKSRVGLIGLVED